MFQQKKKNSHQLCMKLKPRLCSANQETKIKLIGLIIHIVLKLKCMAAKRYITMYGEHDVTTVINTL